MVSVVRELACPARRAISSTATPDTDITDTNVCRSSQGAQTPSMPAFLHRERKSRRTCEASSGVPTLVVNTRPVSCHSGPAARRDDACHLRCSRSAATALCGKASVRRDFSVLVSPCNRTDRHTAMLGGTGVRASGSPSRSTARPAPRPPSHPQPWPPCRKPRSSGSRPPRPGASSASP